MAETKGAVRLVLSVHNKGTIPANWPLVPIGIRLSSLISARFCLQSLPTGVMDVTTATRRKEKLNERKRNR